MTCRGENGPVFSEDIAFAHHFMATRPLPTLSPYSAHHFMATHPLPTLSPYRSASGIGYARPYRSASGIGHVSKKLSKMVRDPASYPVYGRYNELF